MHVEWQGDHRLLGDDVKQDLERELTRLGLDPSKFLVEVRREPDLPGADGLDAIRYDVYITDLEPRIAIHGSYTADTARTGSRSSPKSAVGSMFRCTVATLLIVPGRVSAYRGAANPTTILLTSTQR